MEKVQVVVELSKEDVQGAFFVLREKLTDEMWQKLIEKPIVADLTKLEDQETIFKLSFTCLAVAEIKE